MKTMPFAVMFVSSLIALFCYGLDNAQAQPQKKVTKPVPKVKTVLSDVAVQEYIAEMKALNNKNRKNKIPENILANIVKEAKALQEYPHGETDVLRFAKAVTFVCQRNGRASTAAAKRYEQQVIHQPSLQLSDVDMAIGGTNIGSQIRRDMVGEGMAQSSNIAQLRNQVGQWKMCYDLAKQTEQSIYKKHQREKRKKADQDK